ncbi:unnamed protein product [Eretmochelys imbricata]
MGVRCRVGRATALLLLCGALAGTGRPGGGGGGGGCRCRGNTALLFPHRDSPAAARAGRRRRLGKIGGMSKFTGRDTANTVVLNLKNMEQRKARLKRKPCLKFAVCVV